MRDLSSGVHDQWLDYRDIFDVPNLNPVASALRADAVPFAIRSRPPAGQAVADQATTVAAAKAGSAKTRSASGEHVEVDFAADGAAVQVRAARCSLLVDIPRNGLAIEIRSTSFKGLEAECAERPFDLCAHK